MNRTLVFCCGILGALLFIVASIIGGLQIEGYSMVSQYISESYAAGLPNTQYLRYMYIASGILLALFGFTVLSFLPPAKGVKVGGIVFGIFYGVGTIITGVFPCDMGCPSDVSDISLSQFIHNTAGFFTYCTVPLCLIGIGIASRKFKSVINISDYSLLCGLVALVFVLFLFGDATGPRIGLYQRIIEGAILCWVVRTAFLVLNRTSKSLDL